MRAVRPEPSPPVLLSGWTAGVAEVSRFSCMKFLSVPGIFDYAGLARDSRYRPRSCCLPRILTASASGLYIFAAQCPTPPILYLRFAGSLTVAAQDSRPSGSLLLSCKALSSSASCRFIPAHKNRHYAQNPSTTGSPPSTPNALEAIIDFSCASYPIPLAKTLSDSGIPVQGF